MPRVDDDHLSAMVDAGIQIAGVSAGAYAGALLGTAGGEAMGAAAGQAFALALREYGSRVLSPREQRRVSGLLLSAQSALVLRQTEGRSIRDDGFLDGAESTFDEVIESVLQTARMSYEEKKIPYHGNLLASVAVFRNIDVNTAHYLIGLAGELSWLDYQILSIVTRDLEFPLPDQENIGHPTDWDEWTVIHSYRQLGINGRNFLGAPLTEIGEMRLPAINQNPRMQKLDNGGQLLADLMRLETIPRDQLERTYKALCLPPEVIK